MIKAVFFDIDDTLYHFSQLSKQGMDEVAGYVSCELGVSEADFHYALKRAMVEIGERLGTNHPAFHNRQIRFQNTLSFLGKPIYPYAKEMYRIYWNRVLSDAKPENGLIELLELLQKKGLYLGIGSDMTSYIQNKKLENLGVAKYFNSVVTSEEAGIDKPSKKLFALCAKKAGCKEEECLFIGDNLEKDVLGPRRAGMEAACYNRYSRTDIGKAGCVISSYRNCIHGSKVCIGNLEL